MDIINHVESSQNPMQFSRSYSSPSSALQRPVQHFLNDRTSAVIRPMTSRDGLNLMAIYLAMSSRNPLIASIDPNGLPSMESLREYASRAVQAGSSTGKGFLAFAHADYRSIPIGEAHYNKIDHYTGEMNLSVSDAYQQIGLSFLLLEALIHQARQDRLMYLQMLVQDDDIETLTLIEQSNLPYAFEPVGNKVLIRLRLHSTKRLVEQRTYV